MESETKNRATKKSSEKSIFLDSPRGKKPRKKNSRLSETGGRAEEKLWSFSRKLLPIFDGDEILQFFYRNLLESAPRKNFGLFQGAASQKV